MKQYEKDVFTHTYTHICNNQRWTESESEKERERDKCLRASVIFKVLFKDLKSLAREDSHFGCCIMETKFEGIADDGQVFGK